MIKRLSKETIVEFITRLNRPVLTIEVANRFGFRQHEANTLLNGLAQAGQLSRGTAETLDHGESFIWSIPGDSVTDAS